MPQIAQRSAHIPLSPFRALIPFADAAKMRGIHVHHLNIGQPDIPTPNAAWQAVRKDNTRTLAYSPAGGNWSYRQKLVDYYRGFDVEVTAEDILVTAGASEALLFVMLVCLDQGDEIIVPEPFYANYNGFAYMSGVKIVPVPCYLENGFSLPPIADFEKVITSKTKAIMITNPNNPTGCTYTRDSLQLLGDLAKKNDLFFFADEVYREFVYDDQEFHSILTFSGLDNHAVVFDSISKRYSACGARIGALVTRNDAIREAVLRYAKLRLSPPGLGQLLAEGTLDDDSNYLEEVRMEYDARRKLVYQALKEMPGVEAYLPGGAFYCFAKFAIDDATRFCRWLLEEFSYEGETVMLAAGPGFYATPGRGKDEVRIAYVLNTKVLGRAMEVLSIALKSYPGYNMVPTSVEVSL